MEIINATILDLNELRKLEARCFAKDAWPLLDLIAVLTIPSVIRLKAVIDGHMAGFIAGDPRPIDGRAWIATIGVDPLYQRRGIGRALLRACHERLREKEFQEVKLSVRMSNHQAIALYTQEGYETTEIWKGYYNDGEDGIVMTARI
jgi:ribosomal-protein-alanine N-acetyltransferase